MRKMTDAGMLDLWERGYRRHPLDRALLVLATAYTEAAGEAAADWSIGKRNQALVAVHSHWFGPRLRGWLPCGRCGAKLEFDMDTQGLTAEMTTGPAPREPVTIGSRVYRLPTSRDLARVLDGTDPHSGAVRIAEACLVADDPPAQWSEEELFETGEQLALADPLAEIRVTLHCPECGNECVEPLDIVLFLWTEIEARVRRILVAIHTLATAYGWSEAEILSLTEHRRAPYLEMVHS
jgi:hypothetical protein